MFQLFDTHSHLGGNKLTKRNSELIENAHANSVFGLSFIATSEEDFYQCQTLCEQAKIQFPRGKFVWSAGVHPHEAHTLNSVIEAKLEALCLQANAIGETGLDFYYNHSDQHTQINSFRFHIQLAKKLSKPLVIHCRESAQAIIKTLDEEKIQEHQNPGVLHCFAENQQIAKECLDRGLYLSFSGIITFKNADALREVVKWAPLDRILIETDSPYLAPIPNRGKENEPAFLIHTFETLAQIRPEKRELLSQQLWENSCKLFNIDEQY